MAANKGDADNRRRGANPATLAAESGDGVDGEAAITLGLLDAVHENSAISQRSLASELGIALGLTNAYLRRCVRRGWVKVREAPANRYIYYLTPKGFAEKSRLTARYLTSSFGFYRRARAQCDELFEQCVHQGWRRVALYGMGDLAEIAMLCAMVHPVEIAGVVDPDPESGRFVTVTVAPQLAGLGPVDAVILTEFRASQASYDTLAESISPARILVPQLLKVSRTRVRRGAARAVSA